MYYHLWGCVQSTRVHLWEHKLLSSEQNVWTDIPIADMCDATWNCNYTWSRKITHCEGSRILTTKFLLCDSTWLDFGNTKWAVNNCLKDVFALATGLCSDPPGLYVSPTLSVRFQPWNCNGPPTGHTRQVHTHHIHHPQLKKSAQTS